MFAFLVIPLVFVDIVVLSSTFNLHCFFPSNLLLFTPLAYIPLEVQVDLF